MTLRRIKVIIKMLPAKEESEPTSPGFITAHSRCLSWHTVSAQRLLPNTSAKQKSWDFIATSDKNTLVSDQGTWDSGVAMETG